MPKDNSCLSKRQLRRRVQQFIAKKLQVLNKHENDELNISEPENIEQFSPHSIEEEILDFEDNYNYSSSDSEEEFTSTNFSIRNEVHQWALNNNITNSAFSDLLKTLQKHSCFTDLPSDARTILSTQRSFIQREVQPGNYVHFGLENGIVKFLNKNCSSTNRVGVFISVDGIPVSKSSKSEFWPILCAIQTNKPHSPFCIGLYHGHSKPANQNTFLEDFVNEAKILSKEGIVHNKKIIEFEILGLICDAPARAFITCTKYHSGYSACSKCTQEGERYQNRIVFSDKISQKRTDEDFTRLTEEDAHYRGETILKELEIGLVSKIPFEFMHLICIGVTKKLLNLCIGGKPQHFKLSSKQTLDISNRLENLKPFICSEFNRRPRSLSELPRWKATELRMFVLYIGYVVFEGILPSDYLNHFLSLHCAVYIFSNDKLTELYRDYADQLLKYFVKNFGALYGKENVSYNIHGLLHVADDVKTFGNLNNYSAFCYENYLGCIVKLVRSGNLPLSQVCRRLSERDNAPQKLKQREPGPKSLHTNGPLLQGFSSPQYQKLIFKEFHLQLNTRDKYFQSTNDEIVEIVNIATNISDNKLCILGRECIDTRPLYKIPCDSTILGICEFSKVGSIKVWKQKQVKRKCLVIPIPKRKGFAAFPLVHC